MLRGIDISNWQNGLIPSQMGIDFCIAKATEGLNFVDGTCDGFIQNCIQNGILFGYYHFARENNARTEAEFFRNNTIGYEQKGIPVLDYEVWGMNSDIQWCEEFISSYHELTNVWPMLYISASHCAAFYYSWIPQKCALWVAGYPQSYTSWHFDSPYDVSPWSTETIWQFTDCLNLGNWSIDGNIGYLDANAWMRIAHGDNENSNNNVAGNEFNNSNDNSNEKILTGRVRIELD